MSDVIERKINGLTVRIDREQCIGSGNCLKVAPTVFEIDEDDVVRFRADAPADAPRDRVTEACGVCPVEALFVIDEKGAQLVP